MASPDPHTLFPIEGLNTLCFLKNIVDHPQIQIGDYTYYHDFDNVHDFQNNVRYLFEHSGDKLIIGKFGMIASGATFIMNGANHLTEAISAYPFTIFGGDWATAMDGREFPAKGDIQIGHDVWIGYKATIMAGVSVGHGAIIATNATVTRDVPPYAIVGGNPAQIIRMRFSETVIATLLELAWWEWPIEKITANVQALTGSDLNALRMLV